MLSAESLVARSQRRRLRVTHVVLGCVIGLAALASIALIAGARRSSTVVDRFFDTAPTYDLVVFAPGLERADLRSLPGVAAADSSTYVAMGTPVGEDGEFEAVNALTNDFSVRNPTIRVLEGTWPESDDPGQIVVNEAYVARFGGRPGDVLTMATFRLDQMTEVELGIYHPRGPTYTFTIAAIARHPNDATSSGARGPANRPNDDDVNVLVSDQFWEEHHHEFLDFGAGFTVALDEGQAGVPAFVDALASELGVSSDEVLWEPWADGGNREALASPVRVETTALMVIGIGAGVAAVAALVVLLLLERRRVDDESAALRHIGFTSRQIATVGVLRIIPAAALAAMIAVVGGIVASARFPIGVGRKLELDGGMRFDGVIVIGACAVIVLTLLLAAALSVVRMRTSRGHSSAARVAPAPLPIAIGLHLAAGRGRTRGRWATAAEVFAVAVALAAVVMIAVWSAGVSRVAGEPARRGFVWDAAIGNLNFDFDPQHVADIQSDPRVIGSTVATYGKVALNGSLVEVLGFDPAGNAPPEMVAGRLPVLADEVVLGAGVMRRLGVGIGDTVTLSVAGTELALEGAPTRDVRLRVVGQAIVPAFGESDIADTGLVPFDALAAAGGDTSIAYVLVDVSAATRDAAILGLAADYPEEMLTDLVPGRVLNLQEVHRVPLAGLGVAALLGTAILIASVVAACRGNRRSLAVLRCLGLKAQTQRISLAWQGLVIGLAVLAIGVPLGLLAGSVLWSRIVDDLGVEPGMVAPGGVLAASACIALTAPVATAVLAGGRAGRATLTAELRAE